MPVEIQLVRIITLRSFTFSPLTFLFTAISHITADFDTFTTCASQFREHDAPPKHPNRASNLSIPSAAQQHSAIPDSFAHLVQQ